VDYNTTCFAATRIGAAFHGARSAWTNPVVMGVNHVCPQNPAIPAGRPEARVAALWPVPAPTMQLAMSVELPVVNRKQTNLHKTRISAGGYGAMGPHPEREPA
jgi:hypothetical protein